MGSLATRRKRGKRRLGRLSASPCKEAISASILPCGETARYAGKLGELKVGRNNFSFEKFDDLKVDALKALLLEAQTIFTRDPIYKARREARPED